MKFDVIITEIHNPRAKQVLAHYLAQKFSVSHEKALSMVESLPVAYERDAPERDCEEAVLRLRKIGVAARIMEARAGAPAAAEDSPPVKTTAARAPAGPPAPVAHEMPRVFGPAVTHDAPAGPAKEPRASLRALVVLGAVLIVGGAGAFVYLRNSHRYDILRAQPFPGNGGGRQNPEEESLARQRARSYLDSARVEDDVDKAIKFYKLAVSFNRRNVDAWNGLINAYENAGMTARAAAAREEMRKVFGDGVFSLADIIARYGTATELTIEDNGTLRAEYRPRSCGAANLTEETFYLAKALSAGGRCTAASLYAHCDKGGSLLVYVKLSPFPPSVSAFVNEATITRLP